MVVASLPCVCVSISRYSYTKGVGNQPVPILFRAQLFCSLGPAGLVGCHATENSHQGPEPFRSALGLVVGWRSAHVSLGHGDVLSLQENCQGFHRKLVGYLGESQIFAVRRIAHWTNPGYPSLTSHLAH